MKKGLLILGVIVLVGLAGAGGFWGGMAYQDNQDSQAQTRFFEQRGGQPADGQMPGGGQIPEGMQIPEGGQFQGGFRGMGGTMGEVKSIEGNVLTLSTAQNVTTVNLSADTSIVKTVEGTTDDLEPGVRVMVSGEADKDGNITASQITIVNGDLPAVRTAP